MSGRQDSAWLREKVLGELSSRDTAFWKALARLKVPYTVWLRMALVEEVAMMRERLHKAQERVAAAENAIAQTAKLSGYELDPKWVQQDSPYNLFQRLVDAREDCKKATTRLEETESELRMVNHQFETMPGGERMMAAAAFSALALELADHTDSFVVLAKPKKEGP